MTSYKLVPIEPTEEQIAARRRTIQSFDIFGDADAMARAAYRAEMKAVPAPSDEEIDRLCMAWTATAEHGGIYWWELKTSGGWLYDDRNSDDLRRKDRTRMKKFIAAIQEPKP